jgi:hypothetical protein
MREYRPVSYLLSSIQPPQCPTCNQSRMMLSEVESGPTAFDFRTFECQKCGHLKKVAVSKDPMKSEMGGRPDSEHSTPK